MKLEVRNISCGYDNHAILEHVSFDLEDGDICCILGANGVGKSTLFKTILQLLPVIDGQICINGENIKKWSPKKISKIMAYVEQAHVPSFPYLVKDIAMLGRLGQISSFAQPSIHDYEIVEQALEDVGIRHLRDKVYTDISGGERQLLMIARALAQEPKILILDEPTANLDYGNMIMVLNCLKQLSQKGLCIIFTTHNPNQAFMMHAKTLMLFRNDPYIFGESEKIINEKNLYKAYHAHIQIIEFLDKYQKPIKMCNPILEERENENQNNETR